MMLKKYCVALLFAYSTATILFVVHILLQPSSLFYSSSSSSSGVVRSNLHDNIADSIDGNNNVSNTTNTNKPLFVLHAGPPKTGTTTIQCTLPILSSKLLEDNFIFVGKVSDCPRSSILFSKQDVLYINPRTLARCINNFGRHCGTGDDATQIQCLIDKGGPCQTLQQFQMILDSAKRNRRNVIYSSEGMFDNFEFTPHFKMLLLHFHVKVVVVYRRYYQWLVSRYNSLSKPVKTRIDRKELNMWPDESGKTIAMLQQVMSGTYNDTNRRIDLKGDTWDFFAMYEKHFPDTAAVSMYGDGGILKTFLCDVIHAKKSCKYTDTIFETNRNPSIPLHPDRLTVAAYQKGLIKNKKIDRNFIRRKVLRKERSLGYKELTDYPLACLATENENRILQRSLQEEKLMFANISVDEWEKHDLLIRNEFDMYREKGKFCNVDVEKTLERKEWIDFFKNL